MYRDGEERKEGEQEGVYVKHSIETERTKHEQKQQNREDEKEAAGEARNRREWDKKR